MLFIAAVDRVDVVMRTLRRVLIFSSEDEVEELEGAAVAAAFEGVLAAAAAAAPVLALWEGVVGAALVVPAAGAL